MIMFTDTNFFLFLQKPLLKVREVCVFIYVAFCHCVGHCYPIIVQCNRFLASVVFRNVQFSVYSTCSCVWDDINYCCTLVYYIIIVLNYIVLIIPVFMFS